MPFRCNPGDWFAVPLPDQTWAVGRVVRRDAWAFLGYYFGPRSKTRPLLADVSHLTAFDAVTIEQADISAITSGRYPKLDGRSAWNPSDWPVPPFGDRSYGSDVYQLLDYGDYERLSRPPRRTIRISRQEFAHLPSANIHSPRALVSMLDELLPPSFEDDGIRSESAKSEINFVPGEWCAIPMPESRWAVGRIVHRQQDVIVGYFFGPRREDLPQVSDLKGLTSTGVDEIRKVSDLGLRSGEWPVIGGSRDFDPMVWPVPAFGKPDWAQNQFWRLAYPDNDLKKPPEKVAIGFEEFMHLPVNGVVGHRYVGWWLHRILPWFE